MNFDFSKMLNLGNHKPDENNAAVEALNQSMGLEKKSWTNSVLNEQDKSDIKDVQDIGALFGLF